MAKYGSGSVAALLVDGYDIKGVQTEFTHEIEGVFEETTALGDAWKVQTPVGVRLATLKQQGWFDDAADSVNAALSELQNTNRIVGFGLAGNVIGQKFTGMQGAYGGKYTRQLVRNELIKASAEYKLSGQVDEGLILQHLTTKAADWDTLLTSVDNGASSASGLVGYLWVKSLTLGGHTNLTVKIQHSTDNITFVDLITFTVVTTSPVAYRATVAGTVNRYLAITADFTGAESSTPEATILVMGARG